MVNKRIFLIQRCKKHTVLNFKQPLDKPHWFNLYFFFLEVQ